MWRAVRSLPVVLGLLACLTGTSALLAQDSRPQPAAVKAAAADAKIFKNATASGDGGRYEAWLKANWKAERKNAAELKKTGDQLLAAGADVRAAARSYGMAVVADDRNAAAWLGLARALLAVKVADDSPERFQLRTNATGAAMIAYERAESRPAKAAALAILGEALKRRQMWRPAIDALRISVELDDRPAVREAYEALRNEHGFRIVNHKADVNSASPRLCIEFSEELPLGRSDQGRSDLSKFVAVDGKDPQSIAVEGKQLCVEGLAHGSRYVVTVRHGLPSRVGETLLKQAEIASYMKDRAPSVRTTGKNYVLPNRGQQGLPLVTVNTSKVSVEIYRIGDRGLAGEINSGNAFGQLFRHNLSELRDRTGERVYKGELTVKSRLNEEVTTAFPVSEAVGVLKPGVYVLQAEVGRRSKSSETDDDDDHGQGTSRSSQWFIVSDLGLTGLSGEDGVHAFVRSLATAEPAADVEVRLVARNNEVLGTSRTDARGYVRFSAGLKRGDGGMAPAILVADTGKGDYAFLDLTTAAFDLTDRGVKGREQPGPLDSYVYSDRGVYRPGETVHLTALVRDKALKAVNIPVTLIVSRPDGVEARRVVLTDQGSGGRSHALALAPTAMTGTWRAKVHADPKADPIGQLAFLVEDFVPERLDLKLDAVARALAPEVPGTISVSGRYLYGPAAAGLTLEGEIIVKPSRKDVPGFAGYRFGLAEEKITAVRGPLEGLPQTDAQGNASLSVLLPPIPRTARALEADVVVRMREPGGRAIERTVSLPVDVKQPRIGIRPLFKDEGPGAGELAQIDVVFVAADGRQEAKSGVKWELHRLETSYQWYNRDGQWAHETTTSSRRVDGGSIDTKADAPARISSKVEWGRYRLEVSTGGSGGPASSLQFNAGWWGEETVDSPETLEVALDKPSYRGGDTARVTIASRTAGKALVALIGHGVSAIQEVSVPAGGRTVDVAVPADLMPGAYVAAMLYRPMDEKAKRMPGRSLGVRWLAVENEARRLKVGLDAPAKVRPDSTLEVPVRVTGLAAGESAHVTVAAVDIGILNLTRFESPQPDKWFLAQRRLGVEVRDLYGRLIDGMRAERGTLRSGGDGPAGMRMQGAPPVEAPLSLFSGIVKVDNDGTAKVRFRMPDFNGSVRLMAVAWSPDKTGSAAADVIVRAPLALTVSAPRFLTLGDEARLQLDMHNVEGTAGSYDVSVHRVTTGTARPELARKVSFAAGERKRESLTLRGSEVGPVELAVSVTGPGGIEVRRQLAFDVKVPAGDIRRVTATALGARGGRLTVSSDLFQDLIPDRSKVTVTVGPAARLDLPGLLVMLDRYPYGCAEQTVSRALPLMYYNQVAAQVGLSADRQVKERVQGAIERVLEMQDGAGAFGLWGPRNANDLWLTAYVTDFLTRAKELNYAVKPQALALALDKLQGSVSYASEFKRGGENLAYALYVLARNGRAPAGELRYYADTKLDAFATPLAQAQLGAALAMAGDAVRAEKAFRVAIGAVDKAVGVTDYRGDTYGSGLRDGAAALTLASETSMAQAERARLLDVVARAFAARAHTSTQEQAWLLMAARALAEQGRELALNVGGKPHAGPLLRSFAASDLRTGPVAILNESGEPTDAIVSVTGASLQPEPAVSKGFKIERTFWTLDGKQVDLKSATGGTATLAQNDRLVVVLKVEATENKGGQLLLVDRLPAGLEIENPRLVTSGDVASLGWLNVTVAPEHTEFRDDRFVAAFNFSARRQGDEQVKQVTTATVAYLVRAVTPGSYLHPAATMEDMYRPERYARTASGRLTVTARP